MRRQDSLERELGRWILSGFFVHAFQVFLLAVCVLAIVGVSAANPPLTGGSLIAVYVLLVPTIGLLYWMATYVGQIPWAHRTRYRLRQYEEATAQRGQTVAMRSCDLEIFYRPSYWGYRWVEHGETMTPSEAQQLPPRPEKWTRPAATRRRFPFL